MQHVMKQWLLFVQANYNPPTTSAWEFVEPDTGAAEQSTEKVYVAKIGEASPQEFQDILSLGYEVGSEVRLTRRITGVVADDETQRKDVTVGCSGALESTLMDQSKRLVVVFDIKAGKKEQALKVRCRPHVDDIGLLALGGKASASSPKADTRVSSTPSVFKKTPS